MLFKAKFLLVLTSLAVAACGGTPAKRTTVTEAEFNKEIKENGAIGLDANGVIELHATSTSAESPSQDFVLEMDYGKYHFTQDVVQVRSGETRTIRQENYFVIEKKNDEYLISNYSQQDDQWVREEAIHSADTSKLDAFRFQMALMIDKFSDFTYDSEKQYYTAKNVTASYRGLDFNIEEYRYVFENGKIRSFGGKFTSGQNTLTAEALVKNVGTTTVNLPDGYEPTTPGAVPPSVGQVTEDQFARQAKKVGLTHPASGTANVSLVNKQNGKDAFSGTAKFGFTYDQSAGSWNVETKESSGVDLRTYRTVYNHTISTYVDFLANTLKNYDNVNIKYFFQQTGYRVEVTCLIDYSKVSPASGATGNLNTSFVFEWDLYGMLTKWYMTSNGALSYRGQSISYNEVDDIQATWVY